MRVRFGGEMGEYDRDHVDRKSFGCDKGIAWPTAKEGKEKELKYFIFY